SGGDDGDIRLWDLPLTAKLFVEAAKKKDIDRLVKVGKGVADLGPEARAAIPALLELVKDKDEMTRQKALSLLEQPGPAGQGPPKGADRLAGQGGAARGPRLRPARPGPARPRRPDGRPGPGPGPRRPRPAPRRRGRQVSGRPRARRVRPAPGVAGRPEEGQGD